jgi:hypothetical protein
VAGSLPKPQAATVVPHKTAKYNGWLPHAGAGCLKLAGGKPRTGTPHLLASLSWWRSLVLRPLLYSSDTFFTRIVSCGIEPRQWDGNKMRGSLCFVVSAHTRIALYSYAVRSTGHDNNKYRNVILYCQESPLSPLLPEYHSLVVMYKQSFILLLMIFILTNLTYATPASSARKPVRTLKQFKMKRSVRGAHTLARREPWDMPPSRPSPRCVARVFRMHRH